VLHLAASLGATEHAHGVATGGALRSDVAAAPEMAGGAIAIPRGPGLGIDIDAERLRAAELVEVA
jgi:L-alanine-DL-glutamate epimerase-like enolase superfamily enzyme